jgi:hypothetical protein
MVQEDQPLRPKKAALECRLRPLGHARRRQAQRGIGDSEIRNTIFTGTIKERDGRWEAKSSYIKVVFFLRPCTIFIITVHYLRR